MSGKAVVIGGGITGALSARELATAGWQVTVVEGAHIGAGSSSRTAAGIRQQISTPGTVRGMRYAIDFYRNWADQTGRSDLPIVQSGYLFLHDQADRWKIAQETVGMQQAAGLSDVEALSASEVVDRFPWVSLDAIIGGTWCPSDGFLLPDRIYQDAMDRVRELGGVVLQRAMVAGSRDSGGRLTAVDTGKGIIEGDVFVDCTNAWANRTASLLGAEMLPVDPLKRYLWFLMREGSMTGDQLAAMPLVVAPCGIYVRPENRDSLMMGKKHEAPPEPDFSYDDQDDIEPRFSHKTGIDAVPFEHWMTISEVLPPLGEFGGITATTSGYYGTTPDHNPFLGYDRQIPNLIRLVGFSGHGAMFGPFTARVCLALAEAGADVPTVEIDGFPVDLGPFRIGRPMDHSEQMVI